MSTILSGFHGVSVKNSLQELQYSMDAFFASDIDQSTQLFDKFLVSSLHNESVLLWGTSIPFTCPKHKDRLELLQDLVKKRLSLSTSELYSHPSVDNTITSKDWGVNDLMRMKLDVLCERLRMSDMLDCFVPQPIIRADDSSDSALDRDVLFASLSTVTLLGDLFQSKELSLANVSRLYFAICNRYISSLTWNDLALSPIEGIGQDGTLKMESNLQFDPSKCADSIAIEQPPATANQRAAKVWGSVLSTTHFLPKTGVHRFAVKLDKCERGHIFFGVATARANTKTYVGGDKNGWGFIGTQALWHDRNKIRGDYGSVLRTGAVIVATLDTDLGTLSFGLWKDVNTDSDSAPGPMSPSLASLSSPRRGSAVGNGSGSMIEDWGVAFEGLPLDAKLYPAVGLYQRDDRATLYTITSSNALVGKPTTSSIASSGQVYFPSIQMMNPHDRVVREWNQVLCSYGITFAKNVFMVSIELLLSGACLESNAILSAILPRLASALCLVPSCIPTLSAKYAMELLPLVTRCAKLIDKRILPENLMSSCSIKMREGSWLIKAGPSSCADSDSKGDSENEYAVDFVQKPTQDDIIDACYHGKGKAVVGRTKKFVSVVGAVRGTNLKFIEEWSDQEHGLLSASDSESLIDARLSLDGRKFEGIYRNIKQNTTGKITGVFQAPPLYAVSKDAPDVKQLGNLSDQDTQDELIRTESLLCLAAGRLSLILCSPTTLSEVDRVSNVLPDESVHIKRVQLFSHRLLDYSPILSSGRLNDSGCIQRSIDSVWEKCRALDIKDYEMGVCDIVEEWQDLVYLDALNASDIPPIDISATRNELEHKLEMFVISSVMTDGSFSRLCSDEYRTSLKNIASSILHHSGGCDFNQECVEEVYGTSRRILESGIRNAFSSSQSSGQPRAEICRQYCLVVDSISEFLFQFPRSEHKRTLQDVMDEHLLIFKTLCSNDDLNSLKKSIESRTEKSILRFVGLRAMHFLLASDGSYEGIKNCAAAESAIIALHKLLYTPRSLFGYSAMPGCSSSVQKCIASTMRSIFDTIESKFVSIKSVKDSVTLSSLLLALFPSMGCCQTTLEHCKDTAANCREVAFQDIPLSSPMDLALTTSMIVHPTQRVLQAITSFILSLTLKSQQESENGDFVLQLIVREIKQTMPIVEESYKVARDRQDLEDMRSDWSIYQGRGVSETPTTRENISMTAFTQTSPLMSAKNAISTSHGYLGQLLDVLHCFVHNETFSKCIESSTELLDTLLAAMTSPLPPCSRTRILRLLRPVL
jgi:hypothetical protein